MTARVSEKKVTFNQARISDIMDAGVYGAIKNVWKLIVRAGYEVDV